MKKTILIICIVLLLVLWGLAADSGQAYPSEKPTKVHGRHALRLTLTPPACPEDTDFNIWCPVWHKRGWYWQCAICATAVPIPTAAPR